MSGLAGTRVLLLEDEFLIALHAADMLSALGATVIGPAHGIDEAIRLVRTEPLDAAVLDVNINGTRSDAVADELNARGIPFVYASGYTDDRAEGGAAPPIRKPYTESNLEQSLQRLLAG